jgi:hypothetical protein
MKGNLPSGCSLSVGSSQLIGKLQMGYVVGIKDCQPFERFEIDFRRVNVGAFIRTMRARDKLCWSAAPNVRRKYFIRVVQIGNDEVEFREIIAQIFFQLAVEDVRGACDVLMPVWDRTGGADGYVSLQPATRNERGASRLIGLSVISDNPPRVRITAPAKDLFLRDAHHTIDLGVETSDDIALASFTRPEARCGGSGRCGAGGSPMTR